MVAKRRVINSFKNRKGEKREREREREADLQYKKDKKNSAESFNIR